jgi:hypothetical protein
MLLVCSQLLPDSIKSVAKGDSFLAAVASVHPDLNSLNLSGCGSVTDAGLAKMMLVCSQLLPDSIKSFAKGDSFLAAVASVHPDLNSLNLCGCGSVTDSGLANITNCSKLSRINLRGCNHVTEAGLARIVPGCPDLLPQNVQYSAKGDLFLEVVGSVHADLTSLNLRHGDYSNVTEVGLARIVRSCPNLLPDNIASVGKGDLFLAAVASVHPHLTSLNLCHPDYKNVTDAGLGALVMGCRGLLPDSIKSSAKGQRFLAAVALVHPNVTSLDLSGCIVSDTGLATIATCCANLTLVCLLDGIHNTVTDAGLEKIVVGCPNLLPDNIRSVAKGDLFLAAVAVVHPGLTSINLQHCKHVTDAGLNKIVLGCPTLLPDNIRSVAKGDLFLAAIASVHPDLTSLNLQHCKRVTDAGLKTIVLGCPTLLPDNIDSVAKGDLFLEAVALMHPDLTSLNLRGCKHVTNLGLENIAAGCLKLISLNLRGCSHVTDMAIVHVREGCQDLTSLHLYCCKKVTRKAKALFSPGIIRD